MKTREYYLGRPFNDKINYPYGVARSGDYSVRECEILNSCGSLFQALMKGEVQNPNDTDQLLLNVMAGKAPAVTAEQKVWMKYLDKTEKLRAVPSMLVSFGKNGGEEIDFAEDQTFDSEEEF